MTMYGAGVDLQMRDGVGWLTLQNAHRRNALTVETCRDIVRACDAIDGDMTVGAVVIRGDGGFFCSGADVSVLREIAADPTSDVAVQSLSALYASFVRVGHLAPPTVSMVEGGAVGAGVNLALATDLMVATPDARIDSGFLERGLHPGGGHITLMNRSGGRGVAFAGAVFGVPLSGSEAARRGLCWDAVPHDEIEQYVRELVRRPAADPALARRTKASAALQLGPLGLAWATAVEVERAAQMWSLARSPLGQAVNQEDSGITMTLPAESSGL